jgi:hypothetical protein
MARPFKPSLSSVEAAAIEGKGDRTAAGIVSAMRGANLGSITQAEAARRRVSHEWVRKQRQTTQPPINSEATVTGLPPNNESPTDYSRSRVPRMVSSGDRSVIENDSERLQQAAGSSSAIGEVAGGSKA